MNTDVRGERRARPRGRLLAALLAMALTVAACGSDGEGDATAEDAPAEGEATAPESDDEPAEDPDAGDDTEGEPGAEADGADGADGEFEVVDGVLQPLEDGFPSEPITLWQPFEPGSDDDVFNQLIARIGEQYAPVPIATDTQQMGPGLHYELVQSLANQPRAGDGYHLYAISWFGLTTRAFTNEALADRGWDELRASLRPVNRMTFAPYSFLAPKGGEFETIQDAEEYMRENPGELSIASSSPGGGIHSSTLVWASEAGDLEFNYIPTDSPTEARQVLLGGGADMATSRTEPGLDEEFNFLMITGDNRLEILPDVPAAGEFGYRIPSGTDRGYGTLEEVPQEHVDWLAEWLHLVSQDEEFAEQFADLDTTYVDAEGVEEARQQVVDVFVPILEEQDLVVRDDY